MPILLIHFRKNFQYFQWRWVYIQALEQLHPFFDANNRTLINLLLLRLFLQHHLAPIILDNYNIFDGHSVDELVDKVAEGRVRFSHLCEESAPSLTIPEEYEGKLEEWAQVFKAEKMPEMLQRNVLNIQLALRRVQISDDLRSVWSRAIDEVTDQKIEKMELAHPFIKKVGERIYAMREEPTKKEELLQALTEFLKEEDPEKAYFTSYQRLIDEITLVSQDVGVDLYEEVNDVIQAYVPKNYNPVGSDYLSEILGLVGALNQQLCSPTGGLDLSLWQAKMQDAIVNVLEEDRGILSKALEETLRLATDFIEFQKTCPSEGCGEAVVSRANSPQFFSPKKEGAAARTEVDQQTMPTTQAKPN